MSEQHKLEILRAISKDAEVGKSTVISFNALARATNLTKDQLDKLLGELERDRFITEFIVESSDSYRIILHHKGLDALQDESFI